jgi:hypothetical protein
MTRLVITTSVMLLTLQCDTGSRTNSQQAGGLMHAQTSAAQAIAQLVIDLPALQQFLHPELPERKPLVLISTSEVTPGLTLTKFDQPVQILDLEVAKGRPYLHITEWTQTGTKVRLKFSYPVEGVGGEAELESKDGKWRVTKSEIWER